MSSGQTMSPKKTLLPSPCFNTIDTIIYKEFSVSPKKTLLPSPKLKKESSETPKRPLLPSPSHNPLDVTLSNESPEFRKKSLLPSPYLNPMDTFFSEDLSETPKKPLLPSPSFNSCQSSETPKKPLLPSPAFTSSSSETPRTNQRPDSSETLRKPLLPSPSLISMDKFLSSDLSETPREMLSSPSFNSIGVFPSNESLEAPKMPLLPSPNSMDNSFFNESSQTSKNALLSSPSLHSMGTILSTEPSEISKKPLLPSPSQSSLDIFLSKFEVTPKENHHDKVDTEQCYLPLRVDNKSSSCYRLKQKPSTTNKARDYSIYDLADDNAAAHKKKLSSLRRSGNYESKVSFRKTTNNEDNSMPLKVTNATNCGKRSRSEFEYGDDVDESTPKRAKVAFSTPPSALLSSRRPSTTPNNRRQSFPSTGFARSRADQTPYSSPSSWRQPIKRFTYDSHSLQDLESESGYIDSHCHLDFLFDRNGFDGSFKEFQEEVGFPLCYRGCLAIFCNPRSFSMPFRWRSFLEEENVWASFGCHPHNAKEYNDKIEKDLCAALEHPRVRAVGETGLDYSNRNNCHKHKQFEAFRRQLKIALRKKLPVVVHCREAHEDGRRIIQEILPYDYPIHLHCFTDTWSTCQEWLDLFPCLVVGLTSVLSFASASDVREVAENLPLSRLMLETDAPYFVPRAPTIPKDTRHSHPGMAIHVAAQVAAIKQVPIELVLKAARANTTRIYKI